MDKEIIEIGESLNISLDRVSFISRYFNQMNFDYNENVIDIIKEMNLNLKGNENYLAMFIAGNYFSPIFSKMNNNEQEEFLMTIMDSLKFAKDRIELMADYILDTTKKALAEKISIKDVIKMVIDEKFTNIEKGYLIFIIGLAYK